MSTQTTEFLVAEVLRIHENLFGHGGPTYDGDQRAEEQNQMNVYAKALAERVDERIRTGALAARLVERLKADCGR